MRERVIKLIQSSVDGCARHWAEVIADHLLASGVIVPPCKVGDTVYMPWVWDGTRGVAILDITHIIDDGLQAYVETDFHTDDENYYNKYCCGRFGFDDFGKTVFLSREEAEQALKGSE